MYTITSGHGEVQVKSKVQNHQRRGGGRRDPVLQAVSLPQLLGYTVGAGGLQCLSCLAYLVLSGRNLDVEPRVFFAVDDS